MEEEQPVEYTNDGEYIATYWMPTDGNLQEAINRDNLLMVMDMIFGHCLDSILWSLHLHWMDKLYDGFWCFDPEAMKRFGNATVVWISTLEKREEY